MHVGEQVRPRQGAAAAAGEPREDLVDPQALVTQAHEAQDRRHECRGGDRAERGQVGRSDRVCGRPRRRGEAGLRSRQYAPSPGQHGRYGAHQDLHVEPQRPTVDVLHVEPHPLLEAQGRAAADLPQTGDARSDAQPPAVPVMVEPLVIPQRQRPRAHQAHVTAQHVDQLGQLVQAGFAQPAAQPRDARVAADLEHRAVGLVHVLEVLPAPVRVLHHQAGAQRTAGRPARCAPSGRTPVRADFHPDEHGEHGHDRGRQHECDRGTQQVERALAEAQVEALLPRRLERQHLHGGRAGGRGPNAVPYAVRADAGTGMTVRVAVAHPRMGRAVHGPRPCNGRRPNGPRQLRRVRRSGLRCRVHEIRFPGRVFDRSGPVRSTGPGFASGREFRASSVRLSVVVALQVEPGGMRRPSALKKLESSVHVRHWTVRVRATGG